jgi:carbon storage regulator
MLVLSRKTKQQIQIGSNITITILEVKGQTVRVGIQAPSEISVLRTELIEKVAREAARDAADATSQKRAGESRRLAGGLGPADPFDRNAQQNPDSAPQTPRCRAPRAVTAPLATHPQRTGTASPATVGGAATISRRKRFLV